MHQKKGAVEMQFNWIFVLVAGAIILILFTSFILNQKDASNSKQNALLLRNLDAILSGTAASSGTTNVLTIPEATISFTCNRFSVGELSQPIGAMVLFTPSELYGRRLVSMTREFSLPYRTTNLVYLTSPQYRYYFVGQKAQQVRVLMPNETFSSLILDANEAEFGGEPRARFVFFDQAPTLPGDYSGLKDNEVSALVIRGDLEVGLVEFYQKQGTAFVSTGSAPYIGVNSLLGAVYADNLALYQCVMGNVLERHNLVTDIYLGKLANIISTYKGTGDRCVTRYQGQAYSTDALDTLKLLSNAPFTGQNAIALQQAASQLESQNNFAQLQSCATIY